VCESAKEQIVTRHRCVSNPLAGRVDHLVLLNTYYGHVRTLRSPEMIRLLADPAFKPLASAMLDDTNQRLWLVMHTARMFGLDPGDPDGVGVASVLPPFFAAEDVHGDSLEAIRS